MIKNSDGCYTEHNGDDREEERFVIEAFGVKYHLVHKVNEVVNSDEGANHLEDFEPLGDYRSPYIDLVFAL